MAAAPSHNSYRIFRARHLPDDAQRLSVLATAGFATADAGAISYTGAAQVKPFPGVRIANERALHREEGDVTMGHRKSTISAVTCAVLLAAPSSASAHGPMRQGSMMGGGWGMHPGMMGHGMMPCMMMHPGMMQHGMMGPGMMVGPGMMGMMGPGMGAHGMMGPGMMGGQGMMGQGMGHGMMGPQAETGGGLTVDQAKANLGRWLAMLGNPRLKLGAVKEEDENTIVADIVTQDGALVDRFRIDRHTGFMQRIQ